MDKIITKFSKHLVSLQGLDYIRSKDLVDSLCEEEGHSGFWELFRLFLQLGSEFQNDDFEDWLRRSISPYLPICDEFLKSIFQGNFERSVELGKNYGEEIPFLIVSSNNKIQPKPEIPQYFAKCQFQIGNEYISGIDIWNLFTTGELSVFINLRIDWLIIFSLFYWYVYNEEEDETTIEKSQNFLHIFERFSNKYQNSLLQTQFSKSSIYNLFEYYCYSKKTFLEISSRLTGIESLLFLNISHHLFSKEIDYSKSIKNSLYELEKYHLWNYCILIIYQFYSENEFYDALKYYIPITRQILPEEEFLFSQDNFPKEKYFQIKGDKLYYYSFNESDLNNKIQILFSSISFYFLSSETKPIYEILFNEILPLTSILGEYYEKLFEINDELNFYNFNNESKIQIQILQIYKKLYYHEKLNLSERQTLLEGLNKSFSTFPVRSDICQLLPKEDFTFEELSQIDAIPKSLLLSIE